MSFSNLKTKQQIAYRRSIHDYFATPAPITEALLHHESFEGRVWEPACGEGWMAEVLKRRNEVLATDLIDRGYGLGGVDFLKQTHTEPNIVTNPPYIDKLYVNFPRHALKLARRKVAMLLPYYLSQTLDFQRLMFDQPLRVIYVFRERVATVAEGNVRGRRANVPFVWFVWDKRYTGKPVLEPIWPVQPRPVVSHFEARCSAGRDIRGKESNTQSILKKLRI